MREGKKIPKSNEIRNVVTNYVEIVNIFVLMERILNSFSEGSIILKTALPQLAQDDSTALSNKD